MASETAQRAEHWRRTKNLMIVHLLVWLFFSYIIHWFAPALNKISLFHFPLGYYMAGQGSLIAFVIQLFVFDRQQSKVDQDCGMAED